MVIFVSGSGIMSGNATRVLNLSRYINPDVIFSAPKTRAEGNIKFTKFSFRPLSIAEKSLCILSKKPDIIHCFKTLPTSGIPSVLGKIKGSHLIVDWDDFEGFGGFADKDPFPFNYIADLFEKWIVRKADALTVVSSFLEKKAREYGFRGPVYFIPNGADTEGIKCSFPKPSEKIRLIFTGLLHKSSDLGFVLESMKFLGNDFELAIIGDGPRRKEFEMLAKNLGLKNVSFLGMKPREAVKEYLYKSDIALMPFTDSISNRSRSPVKLGEYLAAGKPVVANPVGIIKDIIENGKNGILTKDNPEDFARGIEKLRSRKLMEKISKNARKTAEKYSWKNIAEKLRKVYESFSVPI